MIEKYLNCAIEAALIAGRILKDGFGTTFQISNKEGKNNLVTEFDKLSEKTIINFISNKFPEHSFLAEESGRTGVKKAGIVRWVIDPLDGTVNFAHSLPIFSISIAAELDGDLLCGVIYNPMLDELYTAIKGQGAFLNDKPLNVSEVNDINTSFLVTGFPYNVNINPCNCIDRFIEVIKQGIPVRRLGSAALDLAYVAAGRFDAFWEIELNPWDVAAGVLIVREAGGTVTQFNNFPYTMDNKTIIASNGVIHEQIVSLIGSCSHFIDEASCGNCEFEVH